LNARAAPIVRADGNAAVVLQHGGNAYRLPPGVTAILDHLDGGAPQPIGRLIEAVASRFDEATVRLLVAMLVKHDIVQVTRAPDVGHDGRP
jgi:hypothetical protein